MEILILLAGEKIGPFSETQIRQYLEEGLVTPSDPAMFEGMEDWQPVEVVLANLPPPAPEPEPFFTKTPPPESPLPEEQTPEPASDFIMQNDAPETLESEPAPPPAETAPASTASQKLKRKIVIQPILPLETKLPVPKKNRTGKVALTLEPLRPTTSLPPVTGFTPKDEKPGNPPILPGQVSLRFLPGKTAAVRAKETRPAPISPPASSATPKLPPPPLPAQMPKRTRAATDFIRRIPHKFLYAGAGLTLVLGALLFYFLASSHEETPPPINLAPPNVVFSPDQVAPQTPAQTVPKTAADFSARGIDRQSKGDMNGALSDFEQALQLDPNNVEALYQRGLARQSKGDLAGALADYTQVLGLDPNHGDAYSNRAYVRQTQGDLDGALADYTQALILNPKIPAAYYNEGLIQVQKGNLDSAIAAYNHALDLNPKMDIAFYNRGVVKNTEGNVDGAIADYTQALALNPNLARAYCDRGIARQSKGDLDGALADYSQALEINPKMVNAYYNRSLIKMAKGDLDGVIADDTQTVGLDPKNGPAYYKRGLALFGKGNLEDALADLRKFCEMVPRDPETDSARLYIWLISKEGNPREHADEDLSTAVENDWNSPPEELTSKIAAFLLGHIRESELIANAASPDPRREPGQYCKVWYFAGMKRLHSGDTTNAIKDFQKCVATDQKDLCEYIFAQSELQALGQIGVTPPKAAPGM